MAGENSGGPGPAPAAAQGASPLFCDFVEERYLPFVRENKRSWKVDAGNLQRHILPYLGAYRLADITADTLTQWIHSLELTGLAPGSCFRPFWTAKYVLNCAVRWGALESDASFRTARLERKPGRRPVLLDSSELVRLMTILKENAHRPAANAIRLMLLTGAGKSEILGARWEDLDFARGVLTAKESFTGRPRLIPLNSEALKLIHRLPRQSGIPWLFHTGRGTRLVYITRDWDRIRRQFGHPDLRLQDLRHTFADHIVQMGVSRSDLNVILGHYKPGTLRLLRERSCADRQDTGRSIILRKDPAQHMSFPEGGETPSIPVPPEAVPHRGTCATVMDSSEDRGRPASGGSIGPRGNFGAGGRQSATDRKTP